MDTWKPEKVALTYIKQRIPDAEVESVSLAGYSENRIILNVHCVSADRFHSMTVQVQAELRLYNVEVIL